MEKLYPIAKAETRHLFVDPSIYQPWDIIDHGYTGEESAFLAPGKIPNLMELCRKENQTFSVTEEPDVDKFFVDELLFGLHSNVGWELFRVGGSDKIKVFKRNAGNWGIDGTIEIPIDDRIVNIQTGERGLKYVTGTRSLSIDIKLNYARGTRCLEWSNIGTYDNNRIKLIGLTLDLTHKDSKS